MKGARDSTARFVAIAALLRHARGSVSGFGRPGSSRESIEKNGELKLTRASVNKSFAGPGGLDYGDGALAKSQVVNAMAEMVKSQKLNPLDVIKFESTGELSPQTQAAIVDGLQGKEEVLNIATLAISSPDFQRR